MPKKPSNDNSVSDIRFSNQGSVWLLFGETEEGKGWIEENVSTDLMIGDAIACEARYVVAIAQGAVEAGLTIEGIHGL